MIHENKALLIAGLAFFLFLMVSMPTEALPSGKIGVLYIGDLARSPPFNMMTSDPLFSMSFVPASLRDDWAAEAGLTIDDVHRRIRLYMPRTTEALADRADIVVLSNGNRLAVGSKNADLIARGVREEGVGLLMAGGWESFGGSGSWSPPWGETSIGEILPTEDLAGTWIQDGRLVIDRPDHELIDSLPWDSPLLKNPVLWHHNLVQVKPGANLLAHALCAGGEEHPLMVTWEIEATRVFALTSEIHTLSWYGKPWKYDYDFGSNLMIYLDGRPVPQEIELVHRARSKILEMDRRKSLLMGLLDFCDSFGANTKAVMSKIDQADDVLSQANEEYLQLRFQEMLETYEVAEDMIEEVEEDAVELKNRALLWVYVIEWLAVTGTALVCGFVLWTVMIQRRYFREVRSTRHRSGR